MCEPLIGKIKSRKIADLVVHEYVDLTSLKSAVEGLIKYHEDEIEDIERIYNEEDNLTEIEQQHLDFIYLSMLTVHYNSILAIEYWEEDAL